MTVGLNVNRNIASDKFVRKKIQTKTLPEDVLICIFSNLGLDDLWSTHCVCHDWSNASIKTIQEENQRIIRSTQLLCENLNIVFPLSNDGIETLRSLKCFIPQLDRIKHVVSIYLNTGDYIKKISQTRSKFFSNWLEVIPVYESLIEPVMVYYFISASIPPIWDLCDVARRDKYVKLLVLDGDLDKAFEICMRIKAAPGKEWLFPIIAEAYAKRGYRVKAIEVAKMPECSYARSSGLSRCAFVFLERCELELVEEISELITIEFKKAEIREKLYDAYLQRGNKLKAQEIADKKALNAKHPELSI